MDKVFLLALREWVRAEIEYAIAQNEVGEDGQHIGAMGERKEADKLFDELCKKAGEQ